MLLLYNHTLLANKDNQDSEISQGTDFFYKTPNWRRYNKYFKGLILVPLLPGLPFHEKENEWSIEKIASKSKNAFRGNYIFLSE